jgi:hypothetical protein
VSAAPATLERARSWATTPHLYRQLDDETVDFECSIDVPEPGALAVTDTSVNPYGLASWLDAVARIVMQLAVIFGAAEFVARHRVVPDNWLIGAFIMGFGWWITVRVMRQRAAEVLRVDGGW